MRLLLKCLSESHCSLSKVLLLVLTSTVEKRRRRRRKKDTFLQTTTIFNCSISFSPLYLCVHILLLLPKKSLTRIFHHEGRAKCFQITTHPLNYTDYYYFFVHSFSDSRSSLFRIFCVYVGVTFLVPLWLVSLSSVHFRLILNVPERVSECLVPWHVTPSQTPLQICQTPSWKHCYPAAEIQKSIKKNP